MKAQVVILSRHRFFNGESSKKRVHLYLNKYGNFVNKRPCGIYETQDFDPWESGVVRVVGKLSRGCWFGVSAEVKVGSLLCSVVEGGGGSARSVCINYSVGYKLMPPLERSNYLWAITRMVVLWNTLLMVL